MLVILRFIIWLLTCDGIVSIIGLMFVIGRGRLDVIRYGWLVRFMRGFGWLRNVLACVRICRCGESGGRDPVRGGAMT